MCCETAWAYQCLSAVVTIGLRIARLAVSLAFYNVRISNHVLKVTIPL